MKIQMLQQLYAWSVATLEAAGVEEPRRDAEVLIADVLNQLPQNTRVLNVEVRPEHAERIRGYVFRRAQHEPMPYILGFADFGGLRFVTRPGALVPDPDSAFWAEVARENVQEGGEVHDVGTGCGAIAVAIAKACPRLVVSASDISPQAVSVALVNVALHEVNVAVTRDAFLPEAKRGSVDFIVANLPYTDRGQKALRIPREYTEFQPEVAMYAEGDEDGLSVIRAFVESIRGVGALVGIQHASSQVEAVTELFEDYETKGFGNRFATFTYGRLR